MHLLQLCYAAYAIKAVGIRWKLLFLVGQLTNCTYSIPSLWSWQYLLPWIHQEGKEQALYFDAHVVDAQRRRHDLRGCRCRFLVRYDHDQSEEIVPLRKVCRRPETSHRLKSKPSSRINLVPEGDIIDFRAPATIMKDPPPVLAGEPSCCNVTGPPADYYSVVASLEE